MVDVGAWSGLKLVAEIAAGNRNEVWQGELNGSKVAVRRSGRSIESLQWELTLLDFLAGQDFWVPVVIPTDSSDLHCDGVVVQEWIDGHEPDSDDDWSRVAQELQRLHHVGRNYPQRPGCCVVSELAQQRTSVDADLDALPAHAQTQVLAVLDSFDDAPVSLIHGDPWAPNLRIAADRVGLLDWDESRVDFSWHDLSNLGVSVLDPATHERADRLSNAWEAVNGWVAEPIYARQRLAKLSVPKLSVPGAVEDL